MITPRKQVALSALITLIVVLPAIWQLAQL